MKYRRFGRTELAMPVISCGGMRYQHKWQEVPRSEIPLASQANLEATVHRALALGINHFETARGYGTSELQLGEVLATLPREKIIVQTKANPKASRAEILELFNTSLRTLGLDYVDLFTMHGINTPGLLEWSLSPEGCLGVARQLQKAGRIRFFGFSTHGSPDLIEAAIGTGEFDYVNLHWYYVNQINSPALAAARRHDLGVFIISPSDKGGRLYNPPAKLAQLCAPLTPMQFNDLFCLARPEVHTLSCGAARPEDFEQHVQALEYYDRIGEVVPGIAQRLHAEIERVTGRDWAAGWSQHVPRYDQVPGQVNIYEILRLWTFAKALDMTDWAKSLYNLLGQAGHWYPGENAAKIGELELTPVLAASPLKERIPQILAEAHVLLHDAPVERLSARQP